jgi:peptidyl-prolyl cis-trans isomerase NIMA-interacting 1
VACRRHPCSGAQNADAGTSGFFGKGDMQKEFEEASFALKPGEVSQVIETASGLHLIERYVHVNLT